MLSLALTRSDRFCSTTSRYGSRSRRTKRRPTLDKIIVVHRDLLRRHRRSGWQRSWHRPSRRHLRLTRAEEVVVPRHPFPDDQDGRQSPQCRHDCPASPVRPRQRVRLRCLVVDVRSVPRGMPRAIRAFSAPPPPHRRLFFNVHPPCSWLPSFLVFCEPRDANASDRSVELTGQSL